MSCRSSTRGCFVWGIRVLGCLRSGFQDGVSRHPGLCPGLCWFMTRERGTFALCELGWLPHPGVAIGVIFRTLCTSALRGAATNGGWPLQMTLSKQPSVDRMEAAQLAKNALHVLRRSRSACQRPHHQEEWSVFFKSPSGHFSVRVGRSVRKLPFDVCGCGRRPRCGLVTNNFNNSTWVQIVRHTGPTRSRRFLKEERHFAYRPASAMLRELSKLILGCSSGWAASTVLTTN